MKKELPWPCSGYIPFYKKVACAVATIPTRQYVVGWNPFGTESQISSFVLALGAFSFVFHPPGDPCLPFCRNGRGAWPDVLLLFLAKY